MGNFSHILWWVHDSPTIAPGEHHLSINEHTYQGTLPPEVNTHCPPSEEVVFCLGIV